MNVKINQSLNCIQYMQIEFDKVCIQGKILWMITLNAFWTEYSLKAVNLISVLHWMNLRQSFLAYLQCSFLTFESWKYVWMHMRHRLRQALVPWTLWASSWYIDELNHWNVESLKTLFIRAIIQHPRTLTGTIQSYFQYIIFLWLFSHFCKYFCWYIILGAPVSPWK